MKRNTVKVGNHFIEVNRTSAGWEVAVIPPLGEDPAGVPILNRTFTTHIRLVEWITGHTGVYVVQALFEKE